MRREQCWACNGSGLWTAGFGDDTRVDRDRVCDWCFGCGFVEITDTNDGSTDGTCEHDGLEEPR